MTKIGCSFISHNVHNFLEEACFDFWRTFFTKLLGFWYHKNSHICDHHSEISHSDSSLWGGGGTSKRA